MTRRILFTLITLACSVAFATTIYKWVDENGVIHYSDQPHENATKLQVAGVQTYSSRAAAVPAPNLADDRQAPNPYKGCVIAQPLNEQSLPNAQSVFIRVQSDPQPRPQDRIFITMDGQNLNNGQPTGLSLNVTPIERGSHTVQAQIRNAGGQDVLCQTPTVTFYVQQPNLFNPSNQAVAPGSNPRPH